MSGGAYSGRLWVTGHDLDLGTQPSQGDFSYVLGPEGFRDPERFKPRQKWTEARYFDAATVFPAPQFSVLQLTSVHYITCVDCGGTAADKSKNQPGLAAGAWRWYWDQPDRYSTTQPAPYTNTYPSKSNSGGLPQRLRPSEHDELFCDDSFTGTQECFYKNIMSATGVKYSSDSRRTLANFAARQKSCSSPEWGPVQEYRLGVALVNFATMYPEDHPLATTDHLNGDISVRSTHIGCFLVFEPTQV